MVVLIIFVEGLIFSCIQRSKDGKGSIRHSDSSFALHRCLSRIVKQLSVVVEP